MRKFNIRPFLLLAGSAPLAIALVACGGGGSSDDDDSKGAVVTAPPVATTAAENVKESGGPAQEIVVSMTDNAFGPKAIEVKAGQPVKFVAKNDGKVIHNMTVLETKFKSETMVNAGKSSTFEATFTKPGTYNFQCDFHVPDMVGTIVVK